MRAHLTILLFCCLAGCGGVAEESAPIDGGSGGDASSGDGARTQNGSDAGDAGHLGDAAVDADPPGPITCGKEICLGTRVCVHPCCGGAAPACFPRPDSGVCPPGTHLEPCGCRMDPCTPDPPYCADAPPQLCGYKTTPRNYSCICA